MAGYRMSGESTAKRKKTHVQGRFDVEIKCLIYAGAYISLPMRLGNSSVKFSLRFIIDIRAGVTVYSIPRLFHPGDKINYPGVKISLE